MNKEWLTTRQTDLPTPEKQLEEMRAAIEQDSLRDWAEAFYARHGRDNW